MEGTPKAKARRQSLPSQHFLSSPQTASDKIPSHAELIRFRDEMGIDSQAYLHAHPPQSYAQLSDQAATTSSNSNSRLKMVRGTIASKGSPSGSHRISMKPETNDIRFDGPSGSAGTLNGEGGAKKKVRKKWTIEETKMLVEGCNKHGVGNWKSMLDDPELQFDADRTPVDLKDRFRTYFPEAYRHLYPNAKTHLSNANSTRARRTELPDSLSIFEKSRSKKRRPFTKEEDEALRQGFEKHGTVWAMIAKNPALASRRSTDLRDRFRNAFPDLYEKAGYKPRPTRPIKKRREDEGGSSSVLQVPSTLSRANSRSNRNAREGSEGRSGSDNPTESSAHRHHRQGEGMSVETTCADTPEGDQAFEDNRCIVVTDAQKDSSMDTDGCYDDARGVRPAMVPIPSSSSDGSAVPSRQRSPSNAQSNNPNEGNEYLSPGEAAHTHLRESPAHQNQQHIPLQQPQFDGGRYADGWYSARWLQGSNDHEEQSPHNNHGQQVPMLMTEFNSSQGLGLNNVHGMNSNNLNAGNLGMLGLGLGNLSAGGWSNQQTIIDRYDLPSSSQQFLLHSGEFQSEAAIGDTGSSISGLDEFGTNLSTSSHHRYAGDLFHGRGAGYGSGWGTFGFMLGGANQEGMPSFARAGLDLGAPGVPNAVRTPNTNPNTVGVHGGVGVMGMSSLDLGSTTQSPEHGQVFRSEVPLDSIEELGHVLGNSVLGSPHSVDPSGALLDISTPPPGTPAPTSPPSRSFANLGGYGNQNGAIDPRANLVRHGSMGGESMTQSRVHQNAGHLYSHHNPHHRHIQGGSSHSRSFSQPPSENRLQVGIGRPTNTVTPSPMKGAFQLESANAYGMGYEAQNTASPTHHQHSISHFSPAGTPNRSLQNMEQRNHSPQHQHQHHQHQHHHHHPAESQNQHQQRTPVQSHAQLQAFNSMYPPPASLLQNANSSNPAWGQLSTVAMALDLHGFQSGHGHPHASGQHTASNSGLGLVTNGLSYGSGTYANAGQFMDQYIDFDTNALDLATAVSPHSAGGSSGTLSMNSQSAAQPQGIAMTQSQNHAQRPTTSDPPSNMSSLKDNFQLAASTVSNHGHNLLPSNTTNHPHTQVAPNSFSAIGSSMGSLDDSIIAQHTHQASHQQSGGMHRRESFSYGTTTSTQHNLATPALFPFSRVHLTGVADGNNLSSPSISHVNNTSSNTSTSNGGNSSQVQKAKGWDSTVTPRSAKRSSWGAFRPFKGSGS